MLNNALLENCTTCGIEFEADIPCEGDHVPADVFNFWRPTHDGSIQTPVRVANLGNFGRLILSSPPNFFPTSSDRIGCEYISKVLNPDCEDVYIALDSLISFLMRYGEPEQSLRSGIHFHITLGNPSLNNLKTIIELGRYFEALFFRVGGMGYSFRGLENDSVYCRPITLFGPPVVPSIKGLSQCFNTEDLMNAKTLTGFWERYCDARDKGGNRYFPARYTWLNIFPLYPGGQYKGTLEFRLFNKTLEITKILAALELCRAFTKLSMALSYKNIRDYGLNVENSVFNNYPDGLFYHQLEIFDEFHFINDFWLQTLKEIIDNTPPVVLPSQYIHTHVNDRGTIYWRGTPYPELKDVSNYKIKKPDYVDVHRLEGER